MYPVTQEYKDTIQQGSSIKRRITGTIGSLAFTGDDILSGSFSYRGQIAHSTDVKLGGVFIQTVKLSFLRPFTNQINRGTWKGRTITINIGLEVDGAFEDVPLGIFTIDDAMHSAVGVDITAYCNMAKFDTSRGMAGTITGSLYDMASLACTNCGVVMRQTAEEFAELPNGTGAYGIYEPNDIENWHDVISWIATTICGYATIDRGGQLVFKTWSEESTIDISQDKRFNDGLFSDFETYYTGISVVNMKTGMTEYTGMPVDDGLTMNIGANPLLQYGTDEVRTARKQAILLALQNFRYVPFSVSSFLDPAFDLGDVLTFPGGRAANAKSCIMSIEYNFQTGIKMAGYGNDPALASARSKVDKNIAGLLSQTDGKTIQYYTYVNPSTIEGIREEETVGSFHFATAEDTTVTIWHEIQLDCTLDDETEPMQVTVHYYLNGEEEAYTPIQTIGESGIHTLDFNYFLRGIAGGLRNEWTVTVECTGGEADIARRGNVHICLSGQGLVGEEAFIGVIEVTEEMPLFVIKAMAAGAFQEAVSVSLNSDEGRQITDSIRTYNVGGTPEADQILDETGEAIEDETGEAVTGEQEIKTPAIAYPEFIESVTINLEIDESMVARIGDGFYCGEDMTTGLYNTLKGE